MAAKLGNGPSYGMSRSRNDIIPLTGNRAYTGNRSEFIALASSPSSSLLRIPAAGLALAACLGMSCEQNREPPGLPAPVLTDIQLRILDPERGLPGVSLAWDYAGDRVSYYEVYQSLDRDSLSAGTQAPAAVAESLHLVLAVPDQARPLTVHYAVRAVWIEPTGQKSVSDTLMTDSLTIEPSLSIVNPAPGSRQAGRILGLEVQTQATFGATLRMAYFEKTGDAWGMKLDTCLPLDGCGRTVFGGSLQKESLVLWPYDGNDTLPSLFCAFGTESFQGHRTGLIQSVACSRFYRVNP